MLVFGLLFNQLKHIDKYLASGLNLLQTPIDSILTGIYTKDEPGCKEAVQFLADYRTNLSVALLSWLASDTAVHDSLAWDYVAILENPSLLPPRSTPYDSN